LLGFREEGKTGGSRVDDYAASEVPPPHSLPKEQVMIISGGGGAPDGELGSDLQVPSLLGGGGGVDEVMNVMGVKPRRHNWVPAARSKAKDLAVEEGGDSTREEEEEQGEGASVGRMAGVVHYPHPLQAVSTSVDFGELLRSANQRMPERGDHAISQVWDESEGWGEGVAAQAQAQAQAQAESGAKSDVVAITDSARRGIRFDDGVKAMEESTDDVERTGSRDGSRNNMVRSNSAKADLDETAAGIVNSSTGKGLAENWHVTPSYSGAERRSSLLGAGVKKSMPKLSEMDSFRASFGGSKKKLLEDAPKNGSDGGSSKRLLRDAPKNGSDSGSSDDGDDHGGHSPSKLRIGGGKAQVSSSSLVSGPSHYHALSLFFFLLGLPSCEFMAIFIILMSRQCKALDFRLD
jgi:hypothetical protein